VVGQFAGVDAELFVGEEQPACAPELKHLGAVVIAPAAMPLQKTLYVQYIYIVARVFRASLEMKGPFVQPEWSKDFARALEQNIPGKRKSKAPILVVQGTADNLVNPEDARALLPCALASGNTMKISWYEGKGHRDVIEPARKEILQWFTDRLQGK
jgi:hypothetical protein